jgi:hypothetical protein
MLFTLAALVLSVGCYSPPPPPIIPARSDDVRHPAPTAQESEIYQQLRSVAIDVIGQGSRLLDEQAEAEVWQLIADGAATLEADSVDATLLTTAKADLRIFLHGLVNPPGAPYVPPGQVPPRISSSDVKERKRWLCPFYPFC